MEKNRPLTERELMQLAEEFDEDEIIYESNDSEQDYCYESDHDTNSEVSGGEIEDSDAEDEDDIPLSHFVKYVGKDNSTEWQMRPPPRKRIRNHNIISQRPGPRGPAQQANTPIETWNCFITDNIIDLIVKHTNIYLDQIKHKFARERDALPTNKAEVKSLFGILYYAGVLKAARLNTKDLWATDGIGIDLFIATMSRKRFLLLLRCLRFDDVRDRSDRRKSDKLAPIRELSELFRTNLLENYTANENVTIDEKLELFRGRCSFRQYIKNKPAKYGMKIFLLTDSKTYYTAEFEIYCGQQPEGPYRVENRPSSIVKRLIQSIDKTGRNLTMDNWFMSMPLVKDLLDNHRITCVGTLRKNKREIPPKFIITKKRRRFSTLFGFTNDVTLLSYKTRSNKIVLLVSSMYHDATIEETSENKKPEIISYYNSTKGGVDTVDELCGTYSVSRKSLRWPLTIFFGFLNVAAINAFVIYKANLRRNFLKAIALDLTKKQLNYRATLENLRPAL